MTFSSYDLWSIIMRKHKGQIPFIIHHNEEDSSEEQQKIVEQNRKIALENN